MNEKESAEKRFFLWENKNKLISTINCCTLPIILYNIHGQK